MWEYLASIDKKGGKKGGKRSLETMTPQEFNQFRDNLNPASCFQSVQFRELEFACGIRRTDVLQWIELDEAQRARLQERLALPSLYDRVKALLPQIRQWVPEGLDISVFADRTITIRAAVRDIQITLLITCALVMAVVLPSPAVVLGFATAIVVLVVAGVL